MSRERGEIILRNEIVNTLRTVLEIIAVALIIILTIGFFNTPFEDGKAVKVDKELLEEREYVELMVPAIEKFTQQSLEIKETSELSNKGKIVPLKVTQVYSENFDEISKDYNALSGEEVPERFKQFHVSFLKAMEYQGAAVNEVLVYLKDKEPSRLDNIDKYNEQFVAEYNNAINLFNRLLEERKVK